MKKKLGIKRETVRVLSSRMLGAAVGGGSPSIGSKCIPWDTDDISRGCTEVCPGPTWGCSDAPFSVFCTAQP